MAYLERPGARLFYERQGEGRPALVFVHGFACTHEDWRAQVECFRARRCVVTCDLRGHGASSGTPEQCDIATYGADVAALLQALQLPPAILIGHSMGCRVVLQAYLEAPQRVAGLVLVDGSHLGSGDPQAAEQGMRQHIQTVGYRTMLRALFGDMFLEHSDPALKARLVERALALPEAIGAALFPRLLRWDAQHMEQALSRVAVPLLVVQSTYLAAARRRIALQPGASTPWLELVRQCVPTAQIEIIGGVGHFTMLEAAEAVNRLLDRFIAALPHAA
jgi:pimeloyl-ACP methyl ester carboxylesterase